MTRKSKPEQTEKVKKQAEEQKAEKPLDPATLKRPEAQEMFAKGETAKQLLEASAEAVEVLGLEGAARRLWADAERAFKSAVRQARKIERSGSKAEREAAKIEKKRTRIAKLKEQLAALLAEEAEDEDE